MSPSVRTGVAAYATYSLLLAVEAIWIAAGPSWFDSARPWAELHEFSAAGPACGAALFGFLALAITRGHRWAWLFAVLWSGLLVFGALALLLTFTPLFSHMQIWPASIARGPMLVGGVISLACLGTGVVSLCRKDARNAFLTGSLAKKGKGGIAGVA